MGIASDIVEKQFGENVRLTTKQTTFNVTTSVQQILENNPDRVQWIIVNNSGNSVYLLNENTVSTSNGILAGANGGFVQYLVENEGDVVGKEVYGVADTGTNTVTVIEVIAERK